MVVALVAARSRGVSGAAAPKQKVGITKVVKLSSGVCINIFTYAVPGSQQSARNLKKH